jgi:hypothetical protein
MKKIICSIRLRGINTLIIHLRDVHSSMRLHGDTVFIPNSQDVRLRNGCISDWLSNAVNVNIRAREGRHEEVNREERDGWKRRDSPFGWSCLSGWGEARGSGICVLRSGLLTFAHEPGLTGVTYLVTLQARSRPLPTSIRRSCTRAANQRGSLQECGSGPCAGWNILISRRA